MRIILPLTILVVSSGCFIQIGSVFAISQDSGSAINIRSKGSAETCSHSVDRIRLSVAPPWKNQNHYEVQINAGYDKIITINFKKWHFNAGVSNIVLSGTAPYSAEDYAYLTNLISCAKFWSLPHRTDNLITSDGNTAVLEATINGHSNSVVITSPHTNMPLRLIRSYMMDSAPFCNHSDLRYWPKLAYSSLYDQICLKFSGKELNERKAEWSSWRTKDDFLRLFGFPHEVRTSEEGVTWGYYLRDRGMMVVVFGHGNGQRQLNRRFLTFSDTNTQEIKKEWLKKGSGASGSRASGASGSGVRVRPRK